MAAVLVAGFLLGVVVGALVGGLQALVLRQAAFGTEAWIMVDRRLRNRHVIRVRRRDHVAEGHWLAGELANQAVVFLPR